jgi:hypothetical protein
MRERAAPRPRADDDDVKILFSSHRSTVRERADPGITRRG